MIDTIITVDNKLEKIGNRCLDELDYLYEMDSSKLTDYKARGMECMKNISLTDILNYLKLLNK